MVNRSSITYCRLIERRILGILMALVWIAPGVFAAEPVKAGWAEVDITPPMGIALGGRGGPDTKAKSVMDPLSAQVLILKDAKGAGFVLVSCDLVGLPPSLSDRLRTRIVHETGVDYNLVVLNTSHTHSGPYMIRELMAGVGPAPQIEVDYFAALTDKIVSATRTARKSLKPVKVETFRGTSQMAINRRGKNKAGKTAMLPNADGPINDEVWVMKISPSDGASPAVVFSYACHPVIVYGFAGAAISADFPGVTRNLLRELGFGHAQFVQGTAGNVRPRATANLTNNTFRAGGTTNHLVAGRQLAVDVMTALKGKGRSLQLDLAAAADRPFLPRGNPPSREIYEKMAAETNEFRKAAAEYWLARYDSGEGFAKGDPWPVGLIRLAPDEWICCFAGEPCVEWAPKVKQWMGGRNVFVWGYSQQGLTYLPTEALLPEGGYEVDECNYTRNQSPARFAVGIEEAVRKSLKQQLAFVEAQQTDPELRKLMAALDQAMTQIEMNTASGALADYWNTKLVEAEKQIEVKLNPQELKRFVESKKQWLRYRDQEVKFQSGLFEGGSIQPLIANTTHANLTQQRVKELHSTTEYPLELRR